jgi:CRP/FNR family transcriptional regulator, cyclic AMP receptor protein
VDSEFMRVRLSPELEQGLRPIMTRREFCRGSTLYRYGAAASGLYLVERGAVRVLLPTSDNKSQLLEIAGPGAILGLSESLSDDSYRVTVQAEEPTSAVFIARKDFVQMLEDQQELCMQVVQLLSEGLHGLYHRFRSVSAHPGRPRRRSLNEKLN